VTADQVRRLVSLVPDAGLVQLPGAGHYGYLDAPEPFLAGTRHFLEAWA
jgi:pimeloyl-ACP methyl ester carboxylesterase